MPLYRYVKAPPHYKRPRRRFPFIVSLLLMTAGSLLLAWVAWPILSFAVLADGLFPTTVSPIADAAPARGVASAPLSPVVLAADSTSPDESTTTVADLTNANLWYPTRPQQKVVTPVNTYTLSIPKLRIKDAQVIIAGDDLMKSLIHYGGTGLPGQYGTAVIFGHSTLPQFFSPTNYRTIFSTLPTLNIGDEVFITYDGITYRYKIFDMIVRDPEDLTVLEQQFDDSYITLVTCVPPGTYWKRLNVKARLVKDGDL